MKAIFNNPLQDAVSKMNRPFPHYKFPFEIEIEYYLMNESECNWHNVKQGSYSIKCTNYGWFPTDILMGTIKGIFADTLNIGANVGGNMGTMSMAVIDIKRAKELLINAGYNKIQFKKTDLN